MGTGGRCPGERLRHAHESRKVWAGTFTDFAVGAGRVLISLRVTNQSYDFPNRMTLTSSGDIKPFAAQRRLWQAENRKDSPINHNQPTLCACDRSVAVHAK